MSNELEQLTKAINLGQQAVEVLSKSHVKEYTRTTASGASVQVKEHDDKRQAAEEATKAADKHQGGMDWSKPDTKKLQELHHDAAKKHIDAMEAAHQAGDGESMRHHFHKASMHLGAAGSAGTFHRKDAADNAKAQTAMADHISAIAAKHKGEKTAHDLDHGSSIHLLAMEQHQRASAAHSAHHNSVYGTPEADKANSKAEGHQATVREHGKSVQHFSGIATKASDHAHKVGATADKTGNTEDHREAAQLHRHAASLDYDSEGRAAHEAKAKEHDKKAVEAEKKQTQEKAAAESPHALQHAANKASENAEGSVEVGDHREATEAHRRAAEAFPKGHPARKYHNDMADMHSDEAERLYNEENEAHEAASAKDKPTEPAKMTEAEAGEHLDKVANKLSSKLARKTEEWENTHNDKYSIPAKEVEGTEARHFDHEEVYGKFPKRFKNYDGKMDTSPSGTDFSPEFIKKQVANGHKSFVLKHPNGNKYLVDTEGSGYARYIAKIKE